MFFSLKLLSIIILKISYFCNSAVVNWFLFSFRNFDAVGIEKALISGKCLVGLKPYHFAVTISY